MSKKVIGILGGMGPLATADLFQKITLHTVAACDQAHPRVCIDSNTDIADRTAALLHGGEDPVPEMIKSCLLYTSPSPRDTERSRMPSSA